MKHLYKTLCCDSLAVTFKNGKRNPEISGNSTVEMKCAKCGKGAVRNSVEVTKEEYKRFSRLYFYQKFFVDDNDLTDGDTIQSLYDYYVAESDSHIDFSDMVFFDEDIIFAINEKKMTYDILLDYYDFILENYQSGKKVKNLREFFKNK